MILQTLQKSFDGRGETKGFKFKQIKMTDYGYIYEVRSSKNPHYEVFRRENNPLCIDFKNHIYSEDTYKESKPNSNKFGKVAWTCMSLERAYERLNQIDKNGKIKEENRKKGDA